MSTGSGFGHCARRNAGLSALCLLVSVVLVGCGGGGPEGGGGSGGGGGGGNPPPPPPPVSVSGGGIKGPLARAPLAFYEFDGNNSDFQASIAAATGITDDQAAFDGVLVPAPNPPYFLVFTANQNTIDLTTGQAPVISRMKTVVTSEMLSQGYPIYATPLTTIAVELAIANAMSTEPPYDFFKQANLVDNFLLALPIAARQVTSSLGFGLSGDIDIFRTWPVVGDDSDPDVLRATAEYRVAVEALSTLAYEIAQDVGGDTTADDVIAALAADLGDGIIDGIAVGGGTVALLGPAQRAILENANPGSLTIPNSTTTVDEVEGLLASEATSIGATADTTALSNGSIEVIVQPAELNPDRDGDGVLNAVDAFPDDAARDTDTDGDGTADDVYILDGSLRRTGSIDSLASDPDDDNDGLLDSDELMTAGTNPLLADSDSDGLLDSIEVAAFGVPVQIVYGEFAGNYVGTGTDALSADSDNDGLLDGVEAAAAGSTVVIVSGPNAGSYTGTGTNPSLSDSDGDGLNDGAEANVGSNPLVTDSDGDGLVDGSDNCPAVANPNQIDDNGDGVGNLCSSDLNGVWKMNLLTTGLTWNGCEAGLLNSTRAHYFSVTQDAAGNLQATDQHGQVLTGVLTPGTNDFTLSGNKTIIEAGSGASIERQLDITARHQLDGSVSGSFVLLDRIDGTATCQQDGTLDAAFVHKHTGSENYSGLYAIEYLDRADLLNDQPTQHSGLMQLQFGANDVTVYDRHPDAGIVSSSFNPDTGVFQVVTLREEIEDWNLDGTDDLVRETATMNGIMVRAVGDNSGATLMFDRRIDEAVYLSTTVYNSGDSASGIMAERQEGYGRFVSSRGFNQTLTRANADGSLAMVDRIGLQDPQLQVATPASTLRFEAFVGSDTSVAPLCSAEFETNMVLVEQYPQVDMTSEALRANEYGYVACEAGAAGALVSGNLYTLAIVDDQGTPLDTLDDQIVYSLPYNAVATSSAQTDIPDRRDLRLDNAGPSQTENTQHIAINGYLNSLAGHTLSWADIGADEYRLRFWEYNPALGMQGHHEIRVSSTTNSVNIPAGVFGIDDYTAIELGARFDDTLNGTSAWSTSRHLVSHSEISGVFNTELTNSVSGQSLYFQFAIQRNQRGAMLCNITLSSLPLACDSFFFVVDPSNNTVGLSLRDSSGQLTGTVDESMLMSLQFSDARTASVSVGNFTGSAEMATTELVAFTQVAADGSQGTQLQLQNPLPLFESAQLDSASGTVDLDGLSTSVQTLWDDSDVDPGNDFAVVARPFWAGDDSDKTPVAVANAVNFDSAAAVVGSHVLPDGGYLMSLRNQLAQGAMNMQYQVSYAAVDASSVQAPLRAAISVNGVAAGAGVGDTTATAININTQAAFDLTWNSAVTETNNWTIVVRKVDVDGSVTGTVGASIPGAEWRSDTLLAATAPALSVTAGAWAWVNDGSLDMAQRLQTGDVVQVQLVASDTAKTMQGLSEPVYLVLGP